MSIDGIFFENQILTAKGLGAFANSALSDGVLTGCKTSISGTAVTVEEGYILICGRVVKIPQQSFTLASSSGVAHSAIIATVDTTAASDETAFEQVSLSVSNGTSDVMSPIANVHSGYDSTNQFAYDINMSGQTASIWLVLLRVDSRQSSIIAYNYAVSNSLDLLWKNTSPTSSFDGSVFVTKFPTLTKYDAVLVTYRQTNESRGYYRQSMVCPFVRGSGDNYIYYLVHSTLSDSAPYTCVMRERRMTINPAAGTISFSAGWVTGGSSSNNGTLIPLEIYGMRAGISY